LDVYQTFSQRIPSKDKLKAGLSRRKITIEEGHNWKGWSQSEESARTASLCEWPCRSLTRLRAVRRNPCLHSKSSVTFGRLASPRRSSSPAMCTANDLRPSLCLAIVTALQRDPKKRTQRQTDQSYVKLDQDDGRSPQHRSHGPTNLSGPRYSSVVRSINCV